MRDIKFRAKSMRKQDAAWYYGLIQTIAKDSTGFLRETNRNCVHIKSDTIGQYIELLDVNGVEIYEGDIIRLIEDYYREDDFEPFIAGEVMFKGGSFCISDGSISRYRWYDYVVEVVGNVHDNSELLGEY